MAQPTEKGKVILHLFQKCIFVLVNFPNKLWSCLTTAWVEFLWVLFSTLKSCAKPKHIYHVRKKKKSAKFNAGFFCIVPPGSGWSLIIMTFRSMVPASRCSTNHNFQSLDVLFSCNSLGISPCAMINVSLSQEFYIMCMSLFYSAE